MSRRPVPLVRVTDASSASWLLCGGLVDRGAGLGLRFAAQAHSLAAERGRAGAPDFERGFGTLYGPNVTATGTVTTGEGLIAGTEYLAYADDGTGAQNVTMLVQLPDAFNVGAPCIITGTSSGSRGVYGAIGSAGEWGLKRGCAVAYVDKGTGNGVHDLATNTENGQNGVRFGAATLGSTSTGG
jgi:hypothetical protein